MPRNFATLELLLIQLVVTEDYKVFTKGGEAPEKVLR